MKKSLFFVAAALFAVACGGNQNAKDQAAEVAENVADKSVELYEEAAPVVEKAAKDAADKAVELYEETATVVEKAANDAADKAVELYEKSKK